MTTAIREPSGKGLVHSHFFLIVVAMFCCPLAAPLSRPLPLLLSRPRVPLSQSRWMSTMLSRVEQHLSELEGRVEEASARKHTSKSPIKTLDPVWISRLRKMRRAESRSIIPQITAENSLGFVPANGLVPGKNSLTRYVMDQKVLHPDKVLLVRVGEFYEAYGVDALMLIEYCGLNPMGMFRFLTILFVMTP